MKKWKSLIGVVLFLAFISYLVYVPPSFSESNIPICETEKTIAVVTDKIHYSLGDKVMVSGCLSEDIKNDNVRLMISSRGEVDKTFLSTIIYPNSDGTFSYEIPAKVFSEQIAYWVDAATSTQNDHVQVYFSKFGKFCSSTSDDNPILVFTDKVNYERADRIEVFGCLSDIAYTKGINVSIIDKNEVQISGQTFAPDGDRTFSTKFEIDAKFPDGTYKVEVDSGKYASSKTIVVSENRCKSVELNYTIENGRLLDTCYEKNTATLTAQIEADSDDQLVIDIQKRLVYSFDDLDCKEGQMIILMDGEVVDPAIVSSKTSNRITIDVQKGTHQIEFIGTVPVPSPSPAQYCGVVKGYDTQYLPPKLQLKLGMQPELIRCNQGLELAIKTSDESPICVTPLTKSKLVERHLVKENNP